MALEEAVDRLDQKLDAIIAAIEGVEFGDPGLKAQFRELRREFAEDTRWICGTIIVSYAVMTAAVLIGYWLMRP